MKMKINNHHNDLSTRKIKMDKSLSNKDKKTKCVICKHGETTEGTTTITLEREIQPSFLKMFQLIFVIIVVKNMLMITSLKTYSKKQMN